MKKNSYYMCSVSEATYSYRKGAADCCRSKGGRAIEVRFAGVEKVNK
jgi:hypothetical protein